MLNYKFTDNLSARFVHVPAIRRPYHVEKLATFLNKFHAITSLDTDAAKLSLVTLAKCLAPLNELICLPLTNAFAKLEAPISAEDQMLPENVAQLESVRSLTLEVFAKSHNALQSAHWGRIFAGLLEAKVTKDKVKHDNIVKALLMVKICNK